MRVIDIIKKKRDNVALTKEEIEFLVNGYVKNEITDYQMSAFLMAVVLNSMNSYETSCLTWAMMNSGKVLNLDQIVGIKVDKHSTGGVGDKTTLVIAPILAALNVPVAKMSGRGLGHTGGTIDKLESIPGFSTVLTDQQFIEQVNNHKIALIGQSDDLVPADKKIYALRDVTGTVDSIPLIASSIMSKKLATGADAILLDVKCGDGAFMKDFASAKELAQTMINIGKELKRDVRVEITNMSKPIGKAIGNRNEVLEAIATLKGEGPKDFTELCYSSSTTLLLQAQVAQDEISAQKMIDEVIQSGDALNKFYELVQLQHGDLKSLQDPHFWNPQYQLEILASQSGYFNITSALTFGVIASKLGAGRITKEDDIDFDAGINLNKKTNDWVNKGDVLFTFYSSKPIDSKLQQEVASAYEIRENQIDNPVIYERMK